MSLQLAAQHLASHGRGNDNMLVHMTPSEVNKLQQLAMAHGGSLTINPHTGLVEAGFLENLLKSLVPMALGAFLGPAGAGIGGGLFESALGAAGAVGLGTAAVTGDLGKGLSAGLSAYGGAELGGSLMGMGSTTIGANAVEAAKAAALEKGLTGEAYNQFIQQSVTDEIGKASLFDKLGAGAKTIANDPTNAGWGFLKQNAIPLMAAAAPILADEMVETSTDMPKLESSAALTPYTYDPSTQKYKALPSTKLAEGGTTMPIPNTNFDVLKAYDELFGKSKNVETATPNVETATPIVETVTPMPNKSQRAYDYLMGRGDYNPAPLSAPIAAAPSSAPTSSQGEGYYEYDPATQSYKWHPKAVETTTKEISSLTSGAGTGEAWSNRGGPGLKEDSNPEWTKKTDEEKAQWFGENQDSPVTKFQKIVEGVWPYKGSEEYKRQLPLTLGISPSTGLSYVPIKPYLNPITGAPMTPSSPAIQNKIAETDFSGMDRGSFNAPFTPSSPEVQAAINSTDFSGMDRGSFNAPFTPSSPEVQAAINSTDFSGMDKGSFNAPVDGGGRGSGDAGGGSRDAGPATGDRGYGSQGQHAADGGYLDRGKFDQRYAYGGIAALAQGGYNLGSYSDGGRLLKGPGDGVSDSIPAVIGRKQPARLADGEFVIPARIVSELGNGSTDAGARKLYAMMDRIQNARKQTVGKGRVAANSRSEKYLPR